MAPPANRITELMAGLLGWLATTAEHPLIAGCVFHYEFEFIHPFTDGNGRMGWLWQALILRDWNALLVYLPVEMVIREHQAGYYQALAQADEQAPALVADWTERTQPGSSRSPTQCYRLTHKRRQWLQRHVEI